jgi:hypothetical protein
MAYSCLVCSYPKLKSPPRSASGGGSYEICPSCGYQYGVDDDDRGITPMEWRRTWIANGAHWSSVGIKAPADWKFGDATISPTTQPKTKAAVTVKATKPAKKVVSVKKAVKKAAPRKKSS